MRVLSFYSPLPQEPFKIHPELCHLWAESWRRQGWTPEILNLKAAAEHPRFTEFSMRVMEFPTINPPGFDFLSWIRWLAFAQAGGGYITDYDCINVGLKAPAEAPEKSTTYGFEQGAFEGAVTFLYLKPEDMEDFLTRMMKESPDYHCKYGEREHVSDMIFFNAMKWHNRVVTGPRYVQHFHDPHTHPVIHITKLDNSDPGEKLTKARSLISV